MREVVHVDDGLIDALLRDAQAREAIPCLSGARSQTASASRNCRACPGAKGAPVDYAAARLCLLAAGETQRLWLCQRLKARKMRVHAALGDGRIAAYTIALAASAAP